MKKDEVIKVIKQLKELLDSGILTQEEYDVKSADLKKIILDTENPVTQSKSKVKVTHPLGYESGPLGYELLKTLGYDEEKIKELNDSAFEAELEQEKKDIEFQAMLRKHAKNWNKGKKDT